jgi:hypothetical protein
LLKNRTKQCALKSVELYGVGEIRQGRAMQEVYTDYSAIHLQEKYHSKTSLNNEETLKQ